MTKHLRPPIVAAVVVVTVIAMKVVVVQMWIGWYSALNWQRTEAWKSEKSEMRALGEASGLESVAMSQGQVLVESALQNSWRQELCRTRRHGCL